MSSDMRMLKFEKLIEATNDEIKDGYGYWRDEKEPAIKGCKNPSLLLIYDYEQLNDFAKVIIEQSSLHLPDWNNKYSEIESFKDIKTKINAAKELVRCCTIDEYTSAYRFIFWAMLVLTVDKTDQEEKFSLICDFSRMLNISDEEMMDILQVIKVIYHEQQEGFDFKTERVPYIFSEVMRVHNWEI